MTASCKQNLNYAQKNRKQFFKNIQNLYGLIDGGFPFVLG